jgi:hypothetical protein
MVHDGLVGGDFETATITVGSILPIWTAGIVWNTP